MARLSQKIKKIQVEETKKGPIISESSMQKMGGSINWIIGQSAAQLGDIQKSILDLATFQSLHGTEWVLCDGQNIVGSELGNLTGLATAPDMRGTFQRSKDNGAGIDTERNIGNEQTDANKNHTHFQMANSLASGGNANGSVTRFAQLGNLTSVFAQGSTIEPTIGDLVNQGSSEARPINISFNMYIKINN